MPISALFGLIVAGSLLLAMLSNSHVLQKVGLLLLFAWAASNVAVDWLGFQRAPLLVPTIDAAVCLGIAGVGFKNRSNVSLAIVCLYVIVGVVHVMALALRMQETYTYYATLNLLFLAQLLILGGSGAWVAIRNRAAGRDQRPGFSTPRHPHPG